MNARTSVGNFRDGEREKREEGRRKDVPLFVASVSFLFCVLSSRGVVGEVYVHLGMRQNDGSSEDSK